MGNTNSNHKTSSSISRRRASGQDSASKQIHIRTDKSDGFYFTGEFLTGTVEIPISFLHQHLPNKTNKQSSTRSSCERSLRNAINIELVGNATYSSERDVAADSDGHSTHQVSICREHCYVTINQDNDSQSNSNPTQVETSSSSDQTTSDTQATSLPLPTTLNGIFQLHIPDDLPPSLINNRPPSLIYTLELHLSSSRSRYQIPVILSSKGCIPYPITDSELTNSVINQHNIHLKAFLSKKFYRPGEQIPVRITYSNPQQRSIRSITITLMQFYRIHNDQYSLQIDGKEWTFDISTMLPQREWSGETLLQLPYQPLQASFSNHSIGTRQRIICELDYRVYIELTEKKGDNIQLTLPSVNVTYQK